MIPRSHPLASVREAYNAVFVESDAAGQLMFYGPGAGGAPTASAVLGDVVTVARNRLSSVTGSGESTYAQCEIAPMGRHRHPLPRRRSTSTTSPACWPRSPSCSPQHDVSIQTVRQEGRGDDAQLVVVTHTAKDAALSATVDGLRSMPIVRGVTSVMRVEGGAE